MKCKRRQFSDKFKAKVAVEAIKEMKTYNKGDIVLCKVKGSVYLHFVKAKKPGQVLIGNAHGKNNGWTSTVYGKTTRIT